MRRQQPIESQIIANVSAVARSPREVGEEFRQLLARGYKLRAYGKARANPLQLPEKNYTPRFAIELFGTRFFIGNLREANDLKVMPAYVLPANNRGSSKRTIHARVLYKDSSLVWRCASHYVDTPDEHWIGKGAVKWMSKGKLRGWYSAEETTNLPFEMQAAMDEISHRSPKARHDPRILALILRNAPSDRVWPYADFESPREHAMSLRANRINNNKPVAWFKTQNAPGSLTFEPGFEPSFRTAIDMSYSRSAMYGGDIWKHRIASRNRRIQYLFVAGPHHVWIVHPQALTVELSSYGLRTVDVNADEDISIPGYEFFDNAGTGEIDDQIPPGFAGDICPYDANRADASPWNHRLPVIQAFRRSKLARTAAKR